jgi:hypothetical protein
MSWDWIKPDVKAIIIKGDFSGEVITLTSFVEKLTCSVTKVEKNAVRFAESREFVKRQLGPMSFFS